MFSTRSVGSWKNNFLLDFCKTNPVKFYTKTMIWFILTYNKHKNIKVKTCGYAEKNVGYTQI